MTDKATERRERLRKDVEDLVANFKRNPETIAEYLEFSARFNRYSYHNLCLIYAQRPTATFVASARAFAAGLPDEAGNRLTEEQIMIRKGEKAIYIWKPTEYTKYLHPTKGWLTATYMKKEELQRAKAEKWDTKKEISWFMVPVFDISQTTAPTELYPKRFGLGHDDAEADALFERIKKYAENELHCTVIIEDFGSEKVDTRGFYRPSDNSIHISDLLKGDGRLSTLIHEIGHAELHLFPLQRLASLSQIELEADMYALMVTTRCGVPVTDARKEHLAHHYRTFLAESNYKKPMRDPFDQVQRRYHERLDIIDRYIQKEETLNVSEAETQPQILQDETPKFHFSI